MVFINSEVRRKDVELLDGVWGKGGNGIEVEAERMQSATKQAHDVVTTSY